MTSNLIKSKAKPAAPFIYKGGATQSSVFVLNRLFRADFSRMEASNIQLFLFRQRIFMGHGWKEDLFRFLLVYNSLRISFELNWLACLWLLFCRNLPPYFSFVMFKIGENIFSSVSWVISPQNLQTGVTRAMSPLWLYFFPILELLYTLYYNLPCSLAILYFHLYFYYTGTSLCW